MHQQTHVVPAPKRQVRLTYEPQVKDTGRLFVRSGCVELKVIVRTLVLGWPLNWCTINILSWIVLEIIPREVGRHFKCWNYEVPLAVATILSLGVFFGARWVIRRICYPTPTLAFQALLLCVNQGLAAGVAALAASSFNTCGC